MQCHKYSLFVLLGGVDRGCGFGCLLKGLIAGVDCEGSAVG